MRRLGQTASAMSLYATDHDDTLPPASAWMDGVRPLVRSERVFRCPEEWREKYGGYGYAMNAAMSQKRLSKIAKSTTTPLLFDSIMPARNSASGLETLPKRGRHSGGNNVAYVDGHVARVPAGTKP